MVGKRGADHDQEIGMLPPNAADRLDAIPAVWHTHVHVSHGIRPPLPSRGSHPIEPFLPSRSAVDFEPQRIRASGRAIEQLSGRRAEVFGRSGPRTENFTEVVVNRWIVIDDENSMHGICVGIHAAKGIGASSRDNGSSTMQVAPRSASSWWARSVPPIS